MVATSIAQLNVEITPIAYTRVVWSGGKLSVICCDVACCIVVYGSVHVEVDSPPWSVQINLPRPFDKVVHTSKWRWGIPWWSVLIGKFLKVKLTAYLPLLVTMTAYHLHLLSLLLPSDWMRLNPCVSVVVFTSIVRLFRLLCSLYHHVWIIFAFMCLFLE